MPKLNTTVKSIRIDDDVLERLEEMKRGESFNAAVNEILTDYVNGFLSGSGAKKSGLPEFTADMVPVFEDLGAMAFFGGMELEDLLFSVQEMMNEGLITVEDGRIGLHTEINVDKFMDRCHELNLRPQEALDKLVMGMR